MNDPTTWARVQEIFHEALDRGADGRDLFLAEACFGDARLESEVRSLLDAHEDDGVIALLDATVSEGPRLYGLETDHVGPWRILRPLGQGGMGMVFLAERKEHDVTQTVALKLLRGEYLERTLVDRFRAERRILARLEHPGIARLIAAGATESGQPYFAMEFVEGTSLMDYCRQNRCTLPQRLGLFLEICEAVEYAHQQLVVHRDLKPGNVLVTDEGRVKLLDFGVAKLLDDEESQGGATRTGAWFTPEYASPEQLRREPVTTLSDVYALGVMLYELLAGVRPFDLSDLSPAAIEQTVSNQLPGKPSDRTTDVRLTRLIRGDLDTIALKALAAEPRRRYASVRELADDIRRFQASEPVRARPDTIAYRASKFIRRHRIAVAAATITVVTLVGALGAVSWQATVAAQARDRAEQALAESQSVSTFLADLFQAADPTRVAGDTAAARAILRQGVAEVDRLAGQPLVQARMLDALGTVFVSLGQYDRAFEFASRALDLRRAHLDPLHQDVVVSLQHTGQALRLLSRYAEAETAYLAALDITRRARRSETPGAADLLADLGFLMPYVARDDKAAEYYGELLALRRRLHGEEHPAVADAMLRVAGIHRRRGVEDSAEVLLREAIDLYRRTLGDKDLRTGTAYFHLGDIIRSRKGDLSEAERLYREGIAIHKASSTASTGLGHGLTALAELLSARGDHVEAEAIMREVFDLELRTFGPKGPRIAGAHEALADELARQRRFDEALPLRRRALQLWTDAVGPRHAAVASATYGLARMLIESGGFAEADSLTQAVIELRTELHGRASPVVGITYSLRGELLVRQRRYAEAETALQTALEILRAQQSEQHVDVRTALARLAVALEGLGRRDEAHRLREQAGLASRT
ncbi:MAG TPA: tetratricopeptide repeat protein [Gemmatimonadaceae bacterium]